MPTQTFNVRYAEEDDLPIMLVMGEHFREESPFYRDLAYDRKKLALDLVKYLTYHNSAAWVVEVSNNVVGLLLAHAFSPPGIIDVLTQDDSVYVMPEYRGKGLSKLLISAYVKWALEKVKEPKHITLSISSGIDDVSAITAFEKCGFIQTAMVMSFTGDATHGPLLKT